MIMSAQITWVIEGMQSKPQDGQYTDVVITAFWRCNRSDQGFTSTVYGSCAFSQPGDPFTPYADLTQDQVLGWCWASGVDKDATEISVAQQLEALINPPVVQLPLPWG